MWMDLVKLYHKVPWYKRKIDWFYGLQFVLVRYLGPKSYQKQAFSWFHDNYLSISKWLELILGIFTYWNHLWNKGQKGQYWLNPSVFKQDQNSELYQAKIMCSYLPKLFRVFTSLVLQAVPCEAFYYFFKQTFGFGVHIPGHFNSKCINCLKPFLLRNL